MKAMFHRFDLPAKGALAALAAGALAVTAASPAFASHDHRSGWRGDWRGAGWDDAGWRGGHGGFARGDRGLVERCARNAEIEARRRGGWRFAQVTEIREIDRTRNGAIRVRGVMEVQGSLGFGRRDDFDRGRFNCFVDGRGRPFIEFGGIRGLR
jgi:hypothetical protein